VIARIITYHKLVPSPCVLTKIVVIYIMEKGSLHSILKTTVYSSLAVQVITGIIDVYVHFLPVSGELAIVKKLLGLEIAVQLIEGTFYVWFASLFSSVKNVTPHRYYDWVITTPTMLFTFCLYLDYLGKRDRQKKVLEPLARTNDNDQSPYVKTSTPSLVPRSGVLTKEEPTEKDSLKNTTLLEYFNNHKKTFLAIFLLNWMMLIFGYLGETGELDNYWAVSFGFVPFTLYFTIIYETFAKYSSFYGKVLYWIMFKIWALYGVAALGSYYWKNISFNILDLFAKNFFGLLLAYTIYTNM